MDKDNKIEELLKPLQIPFTTQLTESNDEFRHAHGFSNVFTLPKVRFITNVTAKTKY